MQDNTSPKGITWKRRRGAVAGLLVVATLSGLGAGLASNNAGAAGRTPAPSAPAGESTGGVSGPITQRVGWGS